MAKKDSIEELQERYEWLRTITEDAISKRIVESEFHGLEQELISLQKSILEAYKNSVQLPHPRDKGDFREEILREALVSNGLIPKKFCVAEQKVRAVATSGAVSPELDIVFYNDMDSIILRRLGKTVDYIPLESIFGTIQVKSKLSKKALVEGLDNVKKFKSLEPENIHQNLGSLTLSSGVFRRFGILFAYEQDLEWKKVCEEIQKFTADNPSELWPNLIVILNRGFLKLGDDNTYAWKNRDQLQIEEPKVHGFPDYTNSCLLNFYLHLMDLLQDTVTGSPEIEKYVRMPLITDGISYKFSHGAYAELLNCSHSNHGTYLKKLQEGKLQEILDFARNAEEINWIKATDIAYGKDGTNTEAYERQPGVVRIYNPDGLELKDILVSANNSLAFESIQAEGMHIWVPYFYIAKAKMYQDCPKCIKAKKRKARTKKT